VLRDACERTRYPPFGAVTASRPTEPSRVHKRVISVVALTSLLPQWSDLDCPAGGGRMSGGDVNRLVEARALDDVEAAHLLLGFGERAIGYQHLAVAVADADGGGIGMMDPLESAASAAPTSSAAPPVNRARSASTSASGLVGGQGAWLRTKVVRRAPTCPQ
jgi:hypothetical protein